jgi:asparagine synthase (glutamine-hydrolysing)
MCGIAGVLYADFQRPVDPAVLKAMGDAVAHRGPDAEGFFRAPGIGLVHRRLAIIDLSGGDQPIGNEDGSIQVVFNGEIYNYRQLRDELLAKGHQFRTRSDTEVLVHLYEEEGEDLVRRLRGMFALALWDGPRRRLLLARDRLGLKPLYIYRDAEKLLFGSELKAILAHPNVACTIDPAAVDDYLSFGMIPGERAIFREIRKLPPAHVVTARADRLDEPPRRYWQFRIEADRRRTLDEWKEALEAKIVETVQAHQIADVPVGAFLSGGLDSSVMVAAQSRLSGVPVQTFSIGFHEAGFSELPYARQIAAQYGTAHTEQIVTPEAAGVLDDLVHYYDEPFADSSAIPSLWVSRLARQHVKVVISGDGGDEALGGYARYAHDLREAWLRQRLPGWLRRLVMRPLAGLWPKSDWLPRYLRAKTALTNLSLDEAAAYANTLTLCRLPLRRRLLAGDLAAELNGYAPEEAVCRYYGSAPAGDPLAGMIATDVNLLLPDDFLTKVDRASMSCGLEVRPPLVDHELLELAAQIPSDLKIRHGQTKWLLRELYRERLPAEIIRRSKHGFEIPVDAWLRGPLREAFETVVLSPHGRAAELIEPSAVRRLYRAHLAKVGRHGDVLWALLVLAHWAEKYLARPVGPRPRSAWCPACPPVLSALADEQPMAPDPKA